MEEIVAVMRKARANGHGWRLRALIVVLWRAGLRIQEALSLAEPDLDPNRPEEAPAATGELRLPVAAKQVLCA